MQTEGADRPSPSETTHDAAPVKTPTEARQGRPYHRLRYVLLVGITLVVLAFVATSLLTPMPPAP